MFPAVFLHKENSVEIIFVAFSFVVVGLRLDKLPGRVADILRKLYQ